MARIRTAGRVLAAGVALGVIATGGVIATATPASAASVPAAQRYAPSIVPDRITLLPAADPTTQQVVKWRSSTGVAQGVVEYRSLTPAPYPANVLSVDAQSRVEQAADLGYTNVVHTATLSGLQPGVSYMYRVGDGTNFSEWQDFDTAAASPDGRFSFVYLGDVQNGILGDASRVVRNAFRDRPNADLVVQVGDLVNDAHSDQQWGELYEAFSYGLGTQQLLTTPGNHEYDGVLSSQFKSMYTYPKNGPQGEGEVYDKLAGTVYYTDHEGVRFISLNSNISDAEGLRVQGEWLDKVLTENTQRWAVVYFHHPVYSLDEGRNNLGIRQEWGPIIEKHNVDLVLNGHDHAYGRGNLVANEKNLPAGADPSRSSTGPVYVSSSVGSKFYAAGPRHWNENAAHLRRLETGLQTYQMIDINGGTLRFESRTADGKFFDGFTITKDGGSKLVVDGVEPQVIDPGTPVPCLGCEPNPDPGPTDPTDPEVPAGKFTYTQTALLDSVMPNSVGGAHTAALPAGVAYHQGRGVLYLGDQNGRKIFEIDPDTDAVRREMTLPENIRDLGIDEERKLLYVGQQNRNWVVVSIADDTFGQVVRGPYPIIESQRSIDVDPVNDYVYVAVPARGIEVFRASTGVSLGVVRGTADAYYVAADPATGMVASTKFQGVAGTPDIQVFDAKKGFSQVWAGEVRPGARQLDIDSTRGLLYVGYTGTSSDRGGFSVHSLATGQKLADQVGPQFGKDGYGIAIDEKRQRVFVANRDFRLNPPGEEREPKAVTVSTRSETDEPTTPTDPTTPTEPEVPGTAYEPKALTVFPTEGAAGAAEIRPVGSAVDPATGLVYVADEMRPARVHVVDPKTDKIVRTLSAPTTDPAGDGLRDIAFDPATGRLTVAFGGNWVVMDAKTGDKVAGPFAFSGGVRGMDVDFAGGRVFGGLRGTGFDVRNATTGELITAVEGPADGGPWRTHGVAYDEKNNLIYVSNSDTEGSTQGIRVYKGTDYTLVGTLAIDGSDFRSIDVDSATGAVVVGHQSTTFEKSGVSVYRAGDLGLVERLSAHTYGNKVYGVSIDPKSHALYVSARDRYPTGFIRVTLPAELPAAPAAPWVARALGAIPTEGAAGAAEIRPVGSAVDTATGTVFVADEMRPARVHVIDPATDKVVRTLTAPTNDPAQDGLRDIAYDAANGVLYVAFGSNWVVMDAESGAKVRGPFAFSGGVRGMDVDFGRGLVYGATRGGGFDVADAATGELKQTVAGPSDGGAWRSHGVAYDAVADLLYISNSDADGSTEGIRVYKGSDYSLVQRQQIAGADFRSIAVDGKSGTVVVGNQSTTFDQSGATVFSASDLSLVKRLSAHEFGNKVYGVSIDAKRHLLYVSARERFPAGVIQVTLPQG